MEVWETGDIPDGFWKDDENIKRASLWLEKKLMRRLVLSDYMGNGLESLYEFCLKMEVKRALKLLRIKPQPRKTEGISLGL